MPFEPLHTSYQPTANVAWWHGFIHANWCYVYSVCVPCSLCLPDCLLNYKPSNISHGCSKYGNAWSVHLYSASKNKCQNMPEWSICSNVLTTTQVWGCSVLLYLSLVATILIAAYWQLNLSLHNICNVFSYIYSNGSNSWAETFAQSFIGELGTLGLTFGLFQDMFIVFYCRMFYLGLV